MKKVKFLVVGFLFFSSGLLMAVTKLGNFEIEYISPVPGSLYNQKETSIILRSKIRFDIGAVNELKIKIFGSRSGEHGFQRIIADGGHVLLIKPQEPFANGEKVEVKIKPNSTSPGRSLEFVFDITSHERKSPANKQDFNVYPEILNGDHSMNFIDLNKYLLYDNLNDSLPEIYTLQTHEICNGFVFISNISFNPNNPAIPFLLILNNQGQPYFYRRMQTPCFDFKVQNDNLFTYYEGGKYKFYGMDPSYNVTDSFYCGNGYSTDVHELQVLQNGYAYLMSYDTQTVNMSYIIEGGDTNASVVGLIIQEVDVNKNVVFQWRSWDHFSITDALHQNLLDSVIDYVHGNSIEPDHDGNIIISSRHMDEITKINRQTGNIIWRLGGKNNMFNFINDPIGFYYQHSARRLQNGNLLLYDNGNFHSPPFSRAVEYKLDEVNMTATKVWEYRNSPDIYGFAMGSVQRLPNGNTLIGWGAANPTVTEVRPNGLKAFELSLPSGIFSYRAFRNTWEGAPVEVPVSNLLFQNFPNPFNSATRIRYELNGNSNVIVKVYDILGREVKTLVNEFKEAGIYYLDFNSSSLSSGVYFYKLVSNNFTESKKMVLIK